MNHMADISLKCFKTATVFHAVRNQIVHSYLSALTSLLKKKASSNLFNVFQRSLTI